MDRIDLIGCLVADIAVLVVVEGGAVDGDERQGFLDLHRLGGLLGLITMIGAIKFFVHFKSIWILI